ncbi:hypothetical protein BR93DRAFT_931732 [Coniochaeta sp. PMI_546]|nr:hypothetical protein BR93DRAFT_931732 [Coniochaeta sp. PMI_546]
MVAESTQIPGRTTPPEPTLTEPLPIFTFAVDDSVKEFTVPLREYLDSHPQFDAIATGCLVFWPSSPPGGGPLHLLLQKRSAHDSMPGRWEIPGGGCDHEDESILHGAVRELWEESGLVATAVVARVGGEHVFFSRRGMRIGKFNFEVEVEGGTGEEPPVVRLDANEHEDYVWATEEECRAGRKGETELRFTTKGQEDAIWEGFRRRKGEVKAGNDDAEAGTADGALSR